MPKWIQTLLFKNKKNLFSEDGFTLIEVLIAITVLAFITIAIVTIQDNSRKTKDRVVEEDRLRLQVETAFSRFEWDFNQIYTPLYFTHEMEFDQYAPEYEKEVSQRLTQTQSMNPQFSKLSYESYPIPTYKYDEKNTIEFFTTSNRRKVRDIKQSTFAWVKYTLEKDENADSNSKSANMWIRKFNPQNPFNSEEKDWDDIKSQILLRNIVKLTYEYWSPERQKWVDNHDLIKNSKHIIYGIKVILEWMDKDEIEQTFVRVFRPNFPYFKAENMYQLKKPDLTQPGQPAKPAGTGN